MMGGKRSFIGNLLFNFGMLCLLVVVILLITVAFVWLTQYLLLKVSAVTAMVGSVIVMLFGFALTMTLVDRYVGDR